MSTWARDVDWAFIRRSESLLDVCWEFFVRSMYFLYPGNWEFTRHQNEGINVVLVSLLLVLSKFGTFFLMFLLLTLNGLLFAGIVYITSIPVSINLPFPLSDVIKTGHIVLVSLFLTLNFRLKGFLGFLLYINTSFEHVYVNWALLLQTADSNYTQLTLENSTCELFWWCWYERRDFGI